MNPTSNKLKMIVKSAVAGIGPLAVVVGLAEAVANSRTKLVYATESKPEEIKLPERYREWKVISVAHEAGSLNDIRAVLGNDAAFDAFRSGKHSLPEGAMIARLAYKYVPSNQNDKVFGKPQSFVAGAPTNIQLMIKDTAKWPTTGGWGYAQFADPRAPNSITHTAAVQCFACHTAVKGQDFIFTHYAP